jgi:hypothetical protein
LPLRLDIAKQLAFWKADKFVDEQSKVFANFQPNKAANTLKQDLEDTKIEYRDQTGKVADFHSLRHTFISNLTRSGVSPKVAQSLARHSTIGLTMYTYTHIGLYDERAAVDSLPELPDLETDKVNKNEMVLPKSGTDDMTLETDKCAYKPAYKKLTKNAFPDKDEFSPTGINSNITAENIASDNPLQNGMLCNINDKMSSSDIERSRRDSNPRYLSVKRFSRPSR